jgi:hypothetical protein
MCSPARSALRDEVEIDSVQDEDRAGRHLPALQRRLARFVPEAEIARLLARGTPDQARPSSWSP